MHALLGRSGRMSQMGLPYFGVPISSGRRTTVVKDLLAATKPYMREQTHDFLEIPKRFGLVLVLLGHIGVFPHRKKLDSLHVAVTRGFLFASFILDLSLPDGRQLNSLREPIGDTNTHTVFFG